MKNGLRKGHLSQINDPSITWRVNEDKIQLMAGRIGRWHSLQLKEQKGDVTRRKNEKKDLTERGLHVVTLVCTRDEQCLIKLDFPHDSR